MSPLIYFTAKDVGCYADGTFGHQHCRTALSNLVHGLRRRTFGVRIDETLVASLIGGMPDDCWDEYEALNILNEHTAEGLVWTFENGDLLLTEIEDES